MLMTVTALLTLTKPFVLMLQCFQELVGAWCLHKIVFHMHPTSSSEPAPGFQPLLLSLILILSVTSRLSYCSRFYFTMSARPEPVPEAAKPEVTIHRGLGSLGNGLSDADCLWGPLYNPFIKLSFYIWSLCNTPNIITETCSVSMVTGAGGELWDRWIGEQKGAGSWEPQVHCAELICLCNV